MHVAHTRTTGLRLTYNIAADRHGSYAITLDERVLLAHPGRTGRKGASYLGSKQAQQEAIQAAIEAIEQLQDMQEQ